MKRSNFATGALALVLALPLLSCAVQSAPPEGADFTHEQRKAFVEAPEQYPKFILPQLIPFGGGLFWLDNDHLIMSVRELPNGWRAGEDPLPPAPLSPVAELSPRTSRIVVVDVNTGEITDAPYAGQVNCVDNGHIVISVTKRMGDRSSAVLLDSSGRIQKQFEAPADILPPRIRYIRFLKKYAIEKFDSSYRTHARLLSTGYRARAGALMTEDGELSRASAWMIADGDGLPIASDPFLHEPNVIDGVAAATSYTLRGSSRICHRPGAAGGRHRWQHG